MSGNTDATSNREVGQTRQSSFASTASKIHQTLEAASEQDYDHVIALVSGGTDSLCAVDAYNRFRESHDLPDIDLVVQTNTGTTLPQTLKTARRFCAERDLNYLEARNQKDGRMLAHRVLEHGWPANSQGGPGSGGHWPEFINRKQDTWDKVYSGFSGEILFISGGRVAESDRRAGNLGDGAVDFGETGDRQPRLTWLAPIHGLLDGQKEDYIEQHDIPKTAAYDFLGYSGDCVACSFDDPRVLNEIRMMCPELAYALETLVVWVYLRIRRGDIDQPIERAVWGTEIEAEASTPDGCQRSLKFGGCSAPNCKAAKAGGEQADD
jgi:3'-phosphoadenosine 5'-phosphosulfate sulfotransferase (PAPS reductase)/FAD synthetase